jgi:hypothetical protein
MVRNPLKAKYIFRWSTKLRLQQKSQNFQRQITNQTNTDASGVSIRDDRTTAIIDGEQRKPHMLSGP